MDSQMYFSWADYLMLAGLLCINVAVGIYYGCFGTKQKTTEQYLHGGKKMKPFPISMSLTASYVSGITLLGVPSDIYLYGTQFMMCVITIILMMLAVIFVFLPVYYKLQLPSSFEYLKLRFGHGTRSLASFLYVLLTITHMPIVIYAPSLALGHAMGVSVHVVSPIICAVCIFYTTLGGFKAVVLSDTIQFSITMIVSAIILLVGTYLAGGVIAVWDAAERGHRIELFNMSLDPTVRQTFWGVSVGMAFTFIGKMGINPSSVQRFLSLPTYQEARRSMFMFGVGSILAKLLSCLIGLVIFARYVDCDPFSLKRIKKPDELLPYYMLDAMGNWKGFSGLFIASVLCTALSSMSTSMNTLSLTIYEDFLVSMLPKNLSQSTVAIVIKSIVVVVGVVSLLMTFVIEKLGGVLQIAISFHGLVYGPLVGLATLGMLFPYANGKGALAGGICSMVLTGVIVGGAQIYTMQGRIKPIYKPLSTAGCEPLNSSLLVPTKLPLSVPDPPPTIFLVSFYYYALIAVTLVIAIGLLVSWMTKKKDEAPVHRDLLSPCIYRFLSDSNADLVLNGDVKKSLIEDHNAETKLLSMKQ